MKAIIIGAGEVGFHLARVLISENSDVVLIDQSAVACQRIQENLDVMTLQGSGASPKLLKEARINHSDLLIAVTHSDEVNMLACLVAKHQNVKMKVARVSGMEFFAHGDLISPEDVGIDILVNPESLIVDDFLRLLTFPDTRELIEFEDGTVQLAAFNIKARNQLIGKSLKKLGTEEILNGLRIVAIRRQGRRTIVPRHNDYIREGDEVFIMGSRSAIEAMLTRCKISLGRKLDRVIIAGANSIGIQLAQTLENDGVNVKLIDKDRESAERASTQLGRTTVLCGDYLEQSFLTEIGVDGACGFVSVMGKDEDDIMACVTAKQNGAIHVSALIQQPRYLSILPTIPAIDGAVSRHLTAVRNILHIVRRGQVISAAPLREVDAEVIEIVVDPTSRSVGKSLKSLRFPNDATIGSVVRNGEILVPDGDLTIQADDRAIVFCMPNTVAQVERLLTER